MMQKELMPLIIPSVSPARNAVRECRTAIPDREDEKPPEVPPKSPRTESRASPRPKQAAHSASSSTSTLHSLSSCATSVSSVSGKSSPQPFHKLHRAESPVPLRSALHNGDGQNSGLSPENPDRPGRSTPPRAESPLVSPNSSQTTGASVQEDSIGWHTPVVVQRSTRDQEVVATRNHNPAIALKGHRDRVGSPWTQKREELVNENVSLGNVVTGKPLWHQRAGSEASVLNRGRTVTREATPVARKLNRAALKGPSLSEEKTSLPAGFKITELSGKMLDSDLKGLKEQAAEQVKNFEVLSIQDVSNLSKVC